jgi:hypothetical protein
VPQAEEANFPHPGYYGAAWVALGRVMLISSALGSCPDQTGSCRAFRLHFLNFLFSFFFTGLVSASRDRFLFSACLCFFLHFLIAAAR